MAKCDDPRCPGWLVDAEKLTVQRCDQCQRFADDGEAAEHVMKIWQRELENRYHEYPDHIHVNCSKNLILCRRCGEYEVLLIGPVKDFLDSVSQFASLHVNCAKGIHLDLDDSGWCELINSVGSKATRVRQGDYGDRDPDEGFDPEAWANELDHIYNVIASKLDAKGVTY